MRLSYIALFILFVLFFATSCSKQEEYYDPLLSYELENIAYGDHPQQVMDIYLPANRNADNTKVFVLIHGGGWGAGDKADYTYFFDALMSVYPDYAIVNLNYQLGTASSPGYPKQMYDIQSALNHVQQPQYGLSDQYFLFGASAGGHLALLYAYMFDPAHQVKGVCNTVGPSDLTDTAYTNHPHYDYSFAALVGFDTYTQNPALYEEVSPVTHVNAEAPVTISFYGAVDTIVLPTQMGLLHDALTLNGVYNEYTMYPGEGHGAWSATTIEDHYFKIINFVNQHF